MLFFCFIFGNALDSFRKGSYLLSFLGCTNVLNELYLLYCWGLSLCAILIAFFLLRHNVSMFLTRYALLV